MYNKMLFHIFSPKRCPYIKNQILPGAYSVLLLVIKAVEMDVKVEGV